MTSRRFKRRTRRGLRWRQAAVPERRLTMAKSVSIGFAELHTQLRITNKLLAAQLRDKCAQKDMVRLLMNTGASDQDIADVLGTTAATVSVTKGRLRKEDEKKATKQPDASEQGNA